MSSNVHSSFQDNKIKDEIGLVSEVLNFTSADPRTLRTSKNAAVVAEVSQLSVDECSSTANFSYEKRKNRKRKKRASLDQAHLILPHLTNATRRGL